MNFITAITLLTKYYPDIVAAVTFAEQVMPAGGSGAQKLAEVQTQLQNNQQLVADLGAGNFAALWPYAEKLVALIVSRAFKKA